MQEVDEAGEADRLVVVHGHVAAVRTIGGLLAIEYALHYQEHLRGLVISDMMPSAPACNEYAEQVLMPQMDQAVLAEIKAFEASCDIENPRCMELLTEHHYVRHVLPMPVADWPEWWGCCPRTSVITQALPMYALKWLRRLPITHDDPRPG